LQKTKEWDEEFTSLKLTRETELEALQQKIYEFAGT
jgi:hypothetical protein